ncbi:hypothetical protein HU830_07650 [Lactobacillus sp. DCY120]|uniref:Uncharacterized protein n=1 Tax=Bombilactobacillus apium TaxID=2675299 RepID=A0A850R4X7_9LACO|nr:hypothetical protein [Bombilactobacillus apium]NVY97021.1 hypothetical protein [Bombilactobacillus apium]
MPVLSQSPKRSISFPKQFPLKDKITPITDWTTLETIYTFSATATDSTEDEVSPTYYSVTLPADNLQVQLTGVSAIKLCQYSVTLSYSLEEAKLATAPAVKHRS